MLPWGRGLCCCCTADDRPTFETDDIALDVSERSSASSRYVAMSPLLTASPNFPRRTSERPGDAAPRSGEDAKPLAGLVRGQAAQPQEDQVSPASGVVAQSTPREKEEAKVKLHGLVREFLQAAVGGILVDVVNPTSELCKYVFTMDKYFYMLTLRPHGVPGEARVYSMKDVTSIYKGPAALRGSPGLQHLATRVVGVETHAEGVLLFHFGDTVERDTFYTCLKILRMSIDVCAAHKTPDAAKPLATPDAGDAARADDVYKL